MNLDLEPCPPVSQSHVHVSRVYAEESDVIKTHSVQRALFYKDSLRIFGTARNSEKTEKKYTI